MNFIEHWARVYIFFGGGGVNLLKWYESQSETLMVTLEWPKVTLQTVIMSSKYLNYWKLVFFNGLIVNCIY